MYICIHLCTYIPDVYLIFARISMIVCVCVYIYIHIYIYAKRSHNMISVLQTGLPR